MFIQAGDDLTGGDGELEGITSFGTIEDGAVRQSSRVVDAYGIARFYFCGPSHTFDSMLRIF